MLGDWMFANPYSVLAKLKKDEGYSNYRRRTVGDFFRAISMNGLGATVDDRLRWGRMRMAPTDIADVTGHHYTYLMNGQGPETGWYGLFTPGERVRLRVINAAAMSYFNLRIPGLPMTVVQTDGQNVEPVTVDELQIVTFAKKNLFSADSAIPAAFPDVSLIHAKSFLLRGLSW